MVKFPLPLLHKRDKLLFNKILERLLKWLSCPVEVQSSRLFRSFPKDLMQSLASENITANFHFWSLSMQVSFHTSSLS